MTTVDLNWSFLFATSVALGVKKRSLRFLWSVGTRPQAAAIRKTVSNTNTSSSLRSTNSQAPHRSHTPNIISQYEMNFYYHTMASPAALPPLQLRGTTPFPPVRFEDDKEEQLGVPVVVWIGVPLTKSADASAITDVIVEWYKGDIERFSGPPLMSVEDTTSPAFGLNHPFNVGLGVPIARQSDGAEGTVAFFFREVQTKDGKPSDRILGVTTKYVASLDTTTPYEFGGTDPQYILVCGHRQFAIAVAKIEEKIDHCLRDIVRLDEEWGLAENKLGSGEARHLERIKTALEDKMVDSETLKALLDQVEAEWQDPDAHRLGVVDWAPEISVGTGDRPYTCDIATFAVDGTKMVNFERNVLDFWRPHKARGFIHSGLRVLLAMKRASPYEPSASRHSHISASPPCSNHSRLRYRAQGQQRPTAFIRCRQVRDSKNESDVGVAVQGLLMAYYTCNSLGVEVAVFNYSRDVCGEAVALLHSGMSVYDGHTYVMFDTPISYVVERIRDKYPFSDFCGIEID
ncbi:hypothetical protein CYLTODRAFT_413667 [Cylindrobasidium torrendii FP15055 ss-10]|uniref:Uncharacterized protein n=1 Tax=Cylindrobasidium torrendii FP15055 ss-10 TaxID=1314674 RepID=A0A0D7B338_9AGAR|nr:hypothetical protein CYLTODRAFT_413667 [Cylindrobasidium torrendii FP15055 ss-10]